MYFSELSIALKTVAHSHTFIFSIAYYLRAANERKLTYTKAHTVNEHTEIFRNYWHNKFEC